MKTRIIAAIIIMCCFTPYLSAQKLSVGYIYPAGGQTGTSVIIEIGGLNLQDATSVLISGEGVKGEIMPKEEIVQKGKKKKRQKLDDQSSPQLADRIQVKVTIDAKAMPGLRDLRLQSSKGVSNKLYFEVGQYPNVLEVPASSQEKPNEVEALPATLCGQVMPGEIDYYAFNAPKGMNLVIAVKGRTLVPYIADAVPGWFQPVIKLTTANGREVAFSDDYRNSVDPVIITRIPEDGKYILSIHDAIFRGREDFNYRIQLGEIPYVNAIYPAAGKIKKKTELTVDGINLPAQKFSYRPMETGYNEVTLRGKEGLISNPVSFFAVEKETTLLTTQQTNVPIGIGENIYGYISKSYQPQRYIIPATKNSFIALEIIGRRNGSLIDGKMKLYSPSGKLVAEADDVEDASQGLMTHHADPVLQYKATANGNYILEVEDLLGKSGTDYHYLIRRHQRLLPFEAFVTPANLTIPRGGTASFKVDMIRKEKTAGALDISIEGFPDGYDVSSLTPSKGSKNWEISITAPLNAKEMTIPLKVIVSSPVKGQQDKALSQIALPADNMMQAFYYTHHIPAAAFVAEIVPSDPFSIELEKEITDIKGKVVTFRLTDDSISIPVRIRREEGFREPIELLLSRKSKQFTLDPVEMQPDETEKVLQIKVNKEFMKKSRNLRIPMNIVGTVKGEIVKKGQRTFQNAKYREMSPGFVLEVSAP